MSTFIDDLKINPNALHTEWIKQAYLYGQWAERHAQATRNRDLIKTKMDVLKAQLDAKIRTHWQSYGYEKKPTEPAIDAYIISNKEYQELQDAYNQQTYNINLYLAARQSLEHKKAALMDLSKLHLAGYYSKLTTPDGDENIETEIRQALCANINLKGNENE